VGGEKNFWVLQLRGDRHLWRCGTEGGGPVYSERQAAGEMLLGGRRLEGSWEDQCRRFILENGFGGKDVSSAVEVQRPPDRIAKERNSS